METDANFLGAGWGQARDAVPQEGEAGGGGEPCGCAGPRGSLCTGREGGAGLGRAGQGVDSCCPWARPGLPGAPRPAHKEPRAGPSPGNYADVGTAGPAPACRGSYPRRPRTWAGGPSSCWREASATARGDLLWRCLWPLCWCFSCTDSR